MKLSRLVANAANERPAIPAPSEVHIRFAELMGQLLRLGSNHNASKLMARIAPSVLRDVAEVPAETLGKWCKELGLALQHVGDADGTPLPNIQQAAEAALAAAPKDAFPDALDAPARPVADIPSLPPG